MDEKTMLLISGHKINYKNETKLHLQNEWYQKA